jgi:ArsR family transcriptional regulator
MWRSSSDLQVFKAGFFRALAHPVRIRILEQLRHGPRTVQALQDALGMDQAPVSQQLAVLRARNLVVATRTGTTAHYGVRDPLVLDLLDTARAIFDNHLHGTQAMLKELRREARR